MEFKGKLQGCFLNNQKKNFVLQIESDGKDIMASELDDLYNSENIRVTITKWHEKRSLNANAYFHILVNKIAEKMGIGNDECKIRLNLEYGTIATDVNGQKVIVKLPKSVNVAEFYPYAKWIADKQEKDIMTSYYVFYKQTHTLDTKEMARLIDGTISEAQQLGIETITPDEKAKMMSLWRENNE